MTGTLRMRTFLAAMLAVMALAFVTAVALPHAAYIRYQSFQGTIFSQLDWIYDRLVFDATPIDVLVIGSSRSARGANAAAIEAELAALGTPLHVANVSMPASGFDSRLTVVRDALRHHPEIRLVIWGVVETFPRDGHQTFEDLGTAGEVLGSPWLINSGLIRTIARLPYRQMELAVASLVPEAFGYHAAFDAGRYPGPTPDLRLFNDPGWSAEGEAQVLDTPAHAAALAAETGQRRGEITWPVLPDWLAWVEFGVSRRYVDELVALSRQDGFKIAFLFLPFYDGYDAPLEKDWLSARGAYWSPDFLKQDPANYADAAHASQRGVDRLTPWLARQIQASLPKEN